MTEHHSLNVVDLCCGAGGWAFAARGLPVRFVAVADIAGDCLETWRINHAADHPGVSIVQADLSRQLDMVIDAVAGRRVDMVLGGIPCEQVSIMRQAPIDPATMEEWHQLVAECLRFVDVVGAPWYCYEDVIQIERHLPPPLFHGHEIPVWRADASEYGPQSRIRTFLGDFPRPEPRRIAERTLGECLRPGPHLTLPEEERHERLIYPGRAITLLAGQQTARVLSLDKPSPTVLAKGPASGNRQRRNWTVVDERGRLRILTLQEFARIQGFPDDALFASASTRAQEMIGRAIPIYVGRAILEAASERFGRA